MDRRSFLNALFGGGLAVALTRPAAAEGLLAEAAMALDGTSAEFMQGPPTPRRPGEPPPNLGPQGPTRNWHRWRMRRRRPLPPPPRQRRSPPPR